MSTLNKTIFFSLQVILIMVSTVAAQDRELTTAQVWAYFTRSQKETKDTPFRERVTGELSESPRGPWEPYSSYVRESVIPDRYRFVNGHTPNKETIQIGRVGYYRRDDGSWARSEPGAPGISRPATMPSFRDYKCKVNENPPTVLTCESKFKSVQDKDQPRWVNTFWFDESGILFKRESIVFNGRNWSRQLKLYEYDPSIRIEAPRNIYELAR